MGDVGGEVPPGNWPVKPEEARRDWRDSWASTPKTAEQMDYAGGIASAFAAREKPGEPNMVLAEAGTVEKRSAISPRQCLGGKQGPV